MTNVKGKEQHTPAMAQFYNIKKDYPDSILFFRMGDFYEMFGDDAIVASKILGIALTHRNKNVANPIPLCGVPYHSYQPYLIKLLRAGKKVAVCEQLEDPKLAKGIVKRGVTRVVTAATAVEDDAIESFDNNFLLCVYIEVDTAYIVAVDVSTGETYMKQSSVINAEDFYSGISVKEAISNEELDIANISTMVRTPSKSYNTALSKVLMHYNTTSENALNIEQKGYIFALDMVLNYFDDLMLQTQLSIPCTLSDNDSLVLDSVAVKTLELVNDKHSLFNTIDNTSTQMGKRLLKNNILRPFKQVDKIERSLNAVEFLVNNSETLNTFKGLLENVYDIERITARLVSGRATAKDLVWLKTSLKCIPEIKAMVNSCSNEIRGINITSHEDIYNIIEATIVDEPPALLTNGGLIKRGANKTVDELKDVKENADNIMQSIVERERKNSGITQLKVSYNKIFGYYFEISKLHSSRVPEHFERKQTLVNAERYTTVELSELEEKIVTADDKLNTIEYQVFQDVRNYLTKHANSLRDLSKNIAELDVIVSHADTAIKNKYVRPIIENNGVLSIKNGRHPVIERVKPSDFVPNDFNLNIDNERLMLITGPNMSGKSTYLRTSALIVIMAHMGAFVPADSAVVSIVDRIFTRVGANDNLSRGESTFMVEMIETASILRNATKNSLIILDEIGRGTSTFDGISIAWAVIEHILDNIGAKTLFATHYHELTDIAENGNGATNYTVDVKEWDGEIIFLRKVIKGTADRSYGIYVGKLAGLPTSVTDRAEEVLSTLEKQESPSFHNDGKKTVKQKIVQPILVFDDSHPVLQQIQDTDINSLTPIQALQLLHDLKEKSKL